MPLPKKQSNVEIISDTSSCVEMWREDGKFVTRQTSNRVVDTVHHLESELASAQALKEAAAAEEAKWQAKIDERPDSASLEDETTG